jgi:hypothetical protein
VSLRLVRLDCASCGSSLRGEPHDILFMCAHCGGASVLGAEGLEAVESTALLPASGRRAQLWKPAWALETEVEVSSRIRADGRPTDGSRCERRFIIPAFSLPLRSLHVLARALSTSAREPGEVPRAPVPGGTLSLDDARTIARFLVVSEEVAKRDSIASVEVEVRVSRFRVAALPFEQDGGELRCAVSGVKV